MKREDFSKEQSWISEIDNFPQLVVMQTFSKAWEWLVYELMAFAQQEILELMNKVKPPYNISILNQKEVYQSLQNKEKFRENLNEILEQRNFIEKRIAEFNFVKKIYPSMPIFYWLKWKMQINCIIIWLRKKLSSETEIKLLKIA
jgi:histidinol-phosphate aminotransferase